MLKNVKLIDESEVNTERVYVGCKVTVLKNDSDTEYEYKIVGSNEADPFNGKISDESPAGSALIGKKEGDSVSFKTPGGNQNYKIIKISK
jgi:transcription elongation factor GreA